ncbi:Gfo/Idh/MocA family protein [Saccharicrinis sp. FJH62]|uniref:Gfo/Idh/MocA family protein n=1 Tax=Saccharicrinis sp. FJH62 TaxID=3344657 RepID=UPI0035D4774D
MTKTKSRREFIKNSSLAVAGLTIAASPFAKTFAITNSNKKVRLAFIGTGSRGNHLLWLLLNQKENSDFELIALCDNYEPSLERALKTCSDASVKPKTYDDHKKLIKFEHPDGVLIATPLHEHAHIAIDCMEAGIHVFCEKAMARTPEDTKAMYDTHLKTGSILLIGHQRVYDPVYQTAIKRIHAGDLGTIGQIRAYWHRNNSWRRSVPEGHPELEKKINWRLYKDSSAGLLTELMSHQLQVANWVLQQTPVSVMGTGSLRFWNDGREVEDNVALIFSYPDNTQFIYDSMTSNRKYGLEEQIMGDKGTMELETNRYFSETPPAAPGILQLVNDIEKGLFNSIPLGNSSWVPETAVKYNGEEIYTKKQGDGTKEQLIFFVERVKAKSAPEWITKEGYQSSIWTLMAEQAIDTGQKITLPEIYNI